MYGSSGKMARLPWLEAKRTVGISGGVNAAFAPYGSGGGTKGMPAPGFAMIFVGSSGGVKDAFAPYGSGGGMNGMPCPGFAMILVGSSGGVKNALAPNGAGGWTNGIPAARSVGSRIG